MINVAIPEPSNGEVQIVVIKKVGKRYLCARTTASLDLFNHVEKKLAGEILLDDLRHAMREKEAEA